MSKIIIEYNPTISKETEQLIRNDVTASMVSLDETSCQYEISHVMDVLEQRGDLCNQKDLHYLNDLVIEGVSYIEF
jgi:hypothetical protein